MQPSCILEFDGASKGNPGQAGAGVVLRADDGTVVKIHLFFFTMFWNLLDLYPIEFLYRSVGYAKVWV